MRDLPINAWAIIPILGTGALVGILFWLALPEPLQHARTGAMSLPLILAPMVSSCEQSKQTPPRELFFEETMMSAERFMSRGRADIHGQLYCAPNGKYVGNCTVKHRDGSRTVMECDAESCKINGQFR